MGNLSWEKQDEFEELIKFYKGNIIEGFKDEGGELVTVPLRDIFSSRIQLSGKRLKNLVDNFTYIFDINEPDEVAE
jgi:hypothetical protein